MGTRVSSATVPGCENPAQGEAPGSSLVTLRRGWRAALGGVAAPALITAGAGGGSRAIEINATARQRQSGTQRLDRAWMRTLQGGVLRGLSRDRKTRSPRATAAIHDRLGDRGGLLR
jgi:hypothetical protein